MTKRKFWQFPWEYRESFFIAGELLILGILLEVIFKGDGIRPIVWPVNMVMIISFISLLLFFYFRFKNNSLIKWLSGIPAAVSSISLFGLVTLLTGIIPQQNISGFGIVHLLGFDHLKYSWLMAVSLFYFLTCLGFVTVRRCNTLNNRNLGFLLNHVGLWVTIATASLGSGDLQRLSVVLKEGNNFINEAYDSEMNPKTLPFGIRLLDFDINEYNPKLVLLKNSSLSIVEDKFNNPDLIQQGMKFDFRGWEITIDSIVSSVIFLSPDAYYIKDTAGSVFAAKITARDKFFDQIVSGWISNSSFTQDYRILQLNATYSVGLTIPEPKVFSSSIELKSASETKNALIEVNKPFQFDGWKLYQINYDIKKGKWSELSVLEAVRDPWLPVVYTGMFLMIAGALYLFVTGRPKQGN